MPERTVTVVGGGVAGMSAACALAEAGLRVRLVERRGFLGGRASSYRHPGADEVVDNCQHVLFGCCTNLMGFYRRVGVADRIHWTRKMTLIEPGGRRTILGPSWLPAPLHGLPSLLDAHAFTWRDKLALGRAFRALLRPVPANSMESLGTWLTRHGQTRGASERFWRLVIASALNADIGTIGMPYAGKVIRELFLNSADGGRMGVSSVPLGELYAGVPEFLRQRGSDVQFNAAAESASWDEDASGWTIGTGARPVKSEFVVLALPFEAMARLLPRMPRADGAEDLAAQLDCHGHWPICSVHLWFDREITELEHAALLDGDVHWMFNKSRLHPWRKDSGGYVEVVISASRAFAALPKERAVEKAAAALAEYFPAVRTARLVKAAFIREAHATFGVPPGVDASRPGSCSPWPNCFLAGDWTATGWPSTMESAARSGHLAAEALCRSLRDERTFLEPDLRPRGLMRFLGSPAASRP